MLCDGQNVEGQARAAITPALRQQWWQRRQGDICDDHSVAMATMPKRRLQQGQRNNHNDASATAAMMATVTGQHQQWQRNACFNASGMLAMMPAAFAKEGNFAQRLRHNGFFDEVQNIHDVNILMK
jgi:hypothetical protein